MSNEFQNVIKVGQVLLTDTVFPRLEAPITPYMATMGTSYTTTQR